MEDHLAVLAHLEVGDTITVINEVPYRQCHRQWWTACTRYYYGSDRHQTMKWIERVTAEPIPPGYRIPVIRGLRNLSHTYHDDQLIHHRLVIVITDILHRYPIPPEQLIQLLDLPRPPSTDLSLFSARSLLSLLLKYGLRYLPLSLPLALPFG